MFGLLARAAAALLCLSAMSLSPAFAQRVVVMVNGQPITSLDVEFRERLIRLSGQKVASRKNVVDELIGEKLKIAEGKRYQVEATKTEIDTAFANMAKRMGASPERLSQILSNAGSSASTLKARIGAELVWNRLVRGRYQSTLQIREKDILTKLGVGSNAPATAYEYVLRPILVVVQRGSPPAVVVEKKRTAEALRTRFQNCEQGIQLARQMRDVAVRAQITRNAADLTPQLRKILDDIEVGRLTPPEVTGNGIQMFALCGKKTTSEDTPEMREARNKIFAERFEAKSKEYLDALRRGAMIEYRE